MRVLYLTHRIPYPPDKGDKIRSYHLLVHLARIASVDLVTHVDDPRDLRHRQVLADLCRSVEIVPVSPLVGKLKAGAALLGSAPLSVAYLTRTRARRQVASLLEGGAHDLVVGFSSQVGAYLPPEGGPPVIMDLVDVDSEKFAAYAGKARGPARAVNALEARRLRRFESWLGRRAAAVVLCTEREARLYEERIGTGRAAVIGNGVVLPETTAPAAARHEGLMVFVGAMDYEPNVEAVELAAREVLPRVQEKVPAARLRIVGRHPTSRVRSLASLPGVEVTGEVPSLGPHLEEAALALVPLRVARGIQNKVLEAMAHGLPVVTTPDVQGSLAPAAGAALRVSADVAGLADHAAALLKDVAARQAAGEAARAYVRAHHDWRTVDARWDELIRKVAGAGAPRALAGRS